MAEAPLTQSHDWRCVSQLLCTGVRGRERDSVVRLYGLPPTYFTSCVGTRTKSIQSIYYIHHQHRTQLPPNNFALWVIIILAAANTDWDQSTGQRFQVI